MPRKRNKRKSQARRPRCPLKPHLTHLPTEIHIKIFTFLGLSPVLTPYSLRCAVLPAFSLALTCRKFFLLFCETVTHLELDNGYYPHAPLHHPSTKLPHLQWCVRNFPSLVSMDLPKEVSMLAASLPNTLSVSNLEVAGMDVVPRLSADLKSYSHDEPGLSTMEALATLHKLPPASRCKLTKLSLVTVPIELLPKLKQWYMRSARQVEDLYISFAFSLEEPAIRDEQNVHVVDFISFFCSNYPQYAPNLRQLTFAIPNHLRVDNVFSVSQITEIEHGSLTKARQRNSHLPLSSLCIALFTDCVMVDEWSSAISSAVNHTTGVFIEAGHDAYLLLSPLIAPDGYCKVTWRHLRAALVPGIIDHVRDDALDGTLLSLIVKDRCVIDRYVNGQNGYRSNLRLFLRAPQKIERLYVHCPLTKPLKRIGIYSQEDFVEIQTLLLTREEGDPLERAIIFLRDVAFNAKGVTRLEVSFEIIMSVGSYEQELKHMLRAFRSLEEFCMVMPREYGEGLVDVNLDWVWNLPKFLDIVKSEAKQDCLQMLELEMLGGMVTEETSATIKQALNEALEAVRNFESARPKVDIDSLGAMLNYWAEKNEEKNQEVEPVHIVL